MTPTKTRQKKPVEAKGGRTAKRPTDDDIVQIRDELADTLADLDIASQSLAASYVREAIDQLDDYLEHLAAGGAK